MKLTLMNSSDPNIKDTHTRHCSLDSCKYGDDLPNEDGYIECTVVSKRGVPEHLNNEDWWDQYGC